MIWFQVRFYDKNHDYKTITLGFKEQDLVNACESFEAFRCAFNVGSIGGKVSWDSVHSGPCPTQNAYFLVPEHEDRIKAWLITGQKS